MAVGNKWQEFCRLYVADKSRNATKAYKDAGYVAKNDDVAAAAASRLLRSVKVQEYIAELEEAAIKKHEVTAERVVAELAKISFLDPKAFFDDKGCLRPLSELPNELTAAIASLEVVENFDMMDGERVFTGYTKKIKFNDKLKGLELLGRYLKMFTDKVEVQGSVNLADVLQAARRRAIEHGSGCKQ